MTARVPFRLGAETLRRDATGLFSFVDSICVYCRDDGRASQYLKPSLEFFSYIRDLGDSTKAYLNTFAVNAPSDPRLYQDYRQKLETVRLGWFWLHQIIKAAIDSDTLNIPYALVETLTRRLRQIRGFQDARFAIFHFDELNYLQMPVSEIKKTTDRLERLIPDPPSFPVDLGLIGIPYSQSSSIYLNYLISHEMGHFVFEKRELRTELLSLIQTRLEEVLGSEFGQASPDGLDWSKDRLESWMEEIFCDLFATWLVGPCYSFSYIELFGLTTILDPSAVSGFAVTGGSVLFSRSHPADLFRLKQQVLLLQTLGWWKEVASVRSHYVDVLRNAAGLKETEFQFTSNEYGHARDTLRAFLLAAPTAADLVSGIMKNSSGGEFDCGLEGYKKHGEFVSRYLTEAVVPSTVYDGTAHLYPDVVTLMNASMKFYLESLEALVNGIEDQNSTLAGHRSRWMMRLESLTGKALEDIHLLVSEEGAQQVGGTFKRSDLGAVGSGDH